MKNEFKKPLIDVIEIEKEEIITTSGEQGKYNTKEEEDF